MSKKNRLIGSAFLLIVAIGLIFSIWKWGEPLLSPLVTNEDSREIIQWAFSIVISLATVIGLIYGFFKFLTAPQKDRKKIIDEKILDYNKILWPTSPEQLLNEYVSQNAREITWIDRGALTKEQFIKHPRILLVGRMKSGKSREIAEFIQKRLEEGTLLSSQLYDITEGMRTFDPELIADILPRKLDRGKPTLFYVNDLPRQAVGKQLEVLGEYLKTLERCSPGYFIATARSDHLQANPRLQAWIRDNQFHVVELPLLTAEQTGRLVDELAFKKGVQVDPEARLILCEELDGTPYHAILTFIYLLRTGEKVITAEAAQQVATKSAQEIWLNIQEQVKEAEPLAAAFFEALAVFYRANVTAPPDMFKAYARSLAGTNGRRYLPWVFNRHWDNVLGMLEKYDINILPDHIQFPDSAAEGGVAISPDEAMTRLEDFALGYRRWLHNSWMRRFNLQADAQQGLMSNLANNNYFRKQNEKALTLIQGAVRVTQPPAALWYNLGLLLGDKGDVEGAEQVYRAAVAADEKFAPAWNNLGVLLKDRGDLEGAERAYRAAVVADEKLATAWNNLGLLLDDREDLEGAERAYRTAVAEDEKDATIWYNLGVLLEDRGNLEGAERAYRTAVAADEKYAAAWNNLGVLLKDRGDLEGAEQAYRTAVTADEKDALAWYNLGALLNDKGDLEGAERAYRTAVAVDEKDSMAWNNLGVLLKDKGNLEGTEQAWRNAVAADEKYAPAWNNLGVLLKGKGHVEGAERAYRAAVAADEKYATAWYNLGVLLEGKGDVEGAERAYRDAVAADEKAAMAWYNLGALLKDKGDLEGAEQAWRIAVAADEKDATAWYNLGVLLEDQSDLAEAEQAYRTAVAADEKFAPASYNLGLLLEGKGDVEGAERAYRAAVAADEKYTPAWNNLGALLKDKGHVEGAERAYRAAVAADEKYAPAWYNLGALLEDNGDVEGAERAYRDAVAADEKFAPTWNNLGLMLKDKGDLVGAEQAWRTAVAADEKLAPAWNNLGALLEDKGDVEGAERAYRTAVAADEKAALAWYNLGVLLRKAGRFADALPVCQQLVPLRPEKATNHAQLGAVYQKLGRVVEAQAELAEARRLLSGETIYDQACIAALCEEVEEALDLLHQALASGEVDRRWVRQDPDWRDFHTDERWIKLTES